MIQSTQINTTPVGQSTAFAGSQQIVNWHCLYIGMSPKPNQQGPKIGPKPATNGNVSEIAPKNTNTAQAQTWPQGDAT